MLTRDQPDPGGEGDSLLLAFRFFGQYRYRAYTTVSSNSSFGSSPSRARYPSGEAQITRGLPVGRH